MRGIGCPGIGDVRQTVDSRERIVMELYDNLGDKLFLYTRGVNVWAAFGLLFIWAKGVLLTDWLNVFIITSDKPQMKLHVQCINDKVW